MQPNDSDSQHHRNSDLPVKKRRLFSRHIVRYVTIASILVTVLLVCGFIYGSYAALGGTVGRSPLSGTGTELGNVGSGTPLTKTLNKGKTLHLLALGDSLTHGLGDARGLGYVGNVTAQYRAQGYHVIESNLGIDGLTSAGLKSELTQASVQSQIRTADVVLISIGGNDLTHAAGLPNIQTKKVRAAQVEFSRNLTNILTEIRSLNRFTPILLIGLYNPFAGFQSVSKQTDQIIENWDERADELVSSFNRTVVVQTFDLFRTNQTKYLYIDHYHPNQQGYARIAERVMQDLEAF